MKRLCVSGAFAVLALVSVPGWAQESETLYVACMTHYGDNDRPSDVTPVARVVWPSVQASRMQISDAYFSVMQQRGERFYKAQCWSAPTAENALGGLNQWEEMSGYAKRPRREQALNDIFPAMFDRSFETLSRMQAGLSRSSYSATAVGSAVDGADNAKIEKDGKDRRERAEAEKSSPPQQLDITAGPSAAEVRAQRHAEVEARNAAAQQKYQEELAKQQQAVADFNAATDRVANEKAAQAARAQAAAEEFQRQQAAHAAEVERQRQEYREQYKQVTGSYPSD